MMKTLVPYLIILLLSYATGIFYVLSMIEKPIWKDMLSSKKIFPNESLMRSIHGQLKRLTTLLPPMMVTSMLGSATLIIYQYFLLKSTMSLVLLVIFFSGLGYLIFHLKNRIDGVAKIDSDAEYKVLNRGVIRLAQLHHVGLLVAIISWLLQLIVVFLQ